MLPTSRSLRLFGLAFIVAAITITPESHAARYHLRTRTQSFFDRNLGTPPSRTEGGVRYYDHWKQAATESVNAADSASKPVTVSPAVLQN